MVWEGLLDFENEEYVIFLSLICIELSSSLAPAILEYLSKILDTIYRQTPAAKPGAHPSSPHKGKQSN